jgi:hypothetical protein
METDKSVLNKTAFQQLQSQLDSTTEFNDSLALQFMNGYSHSLQTKSPKHQAISNITSLGAIPFQQLNNFQTTSNSIVLNKNPVVNLAPAYGQHLSTQNAYADPVSSMYLEYLNAIAIKQYNAAMQTQFCQKNSQVNVLQMLNLALKT